MAVHDSLPEKSSYINDPTKKQRLIAAKPASWSSSSNQAETTFIPPGPQPEQQLPSGYHGTTREMPRFTHQTEDLCSAEANSFTSFSKLPNELQNKIWAYACKVPRVLEIVGSKPGYVTLFHDLCYLCTDRVGNVYFAAKTQLVPAVLPTCYLSRQQALKTYSNVYFRKRIGQYPEYTDLRESYFYFNSAIDTLYLRYMDHNSMLYFRDALWCVLPIHHIAVDLDRLPEREGGDGPDYWDLIVFQQYVNLKEITFVVDPLIDTLPWLPPASNSALSPVEAGSYTEQREWIIKLIEYANDSRGSTAYASFAAWAASVWVDYPVRWRNMPAMKLMKIERDAMTFNMLK